MAVLTWQNVDGPRTGYGAPSISDALQSVNNGFNALQNTAKQYRDDSIANFENQKAQNTGALINSLANINSIDDLDKHVASGAFNADALRQQFGGAIDYKTLNDALMARRGQIQTDSENQLKLNEDTDFQAHQGDLARLMGLANTNVAGYNAALANTNLGAAAGRILAAVNPAMDNTRQDATTQRGQSLSYAAQMAGVGVERDRLALAKHAQDYKEAQDAKDDHSDAYTAGISFGHTNAPNMSDNDLQKKLMNDPKFMAMSPGDQAAYLKGAGVGSSAVNSLTDAQKQSLQLYTAPVDTAKQRLDDTLTLAKNNFELSKPEYQALHGSAKFSGLSQTDVIDAIMKNTNYEDRGGLADMINKTVKETGADYATVASVAQNALQSSAFRMWGFGREGVKLDKDTLKEGVQKIQQYATSGQGKADDTSFKMLEAPGQALTQEYATLKQQLTRQL
ncbi:hypothetical protein, partial [Pseudescherichia sp.]|uniref:hypothetical protein n=1 Tax=Pseudescherichia sp. TaxID=2055881 RepID=UPI0028A60427